MRLMFSSLSARQLRVLRNCGELIDPGWISLGSTYLPNTGALKTSSGFFHSIPSARETLSMEVQLGGNSLSSKSGELSLFTFDLMH